METQPIVVPASDPSIADLRAMLADPSASEPVVKAEPVAEKTEQAAEPEPAKGSVSRETEETPKRGKDGKFVKAKEPGDEGTTQEPEKTVEEEPLPENVQKRIAKEVAKQAKIDREIAEAVSRTKAKQAELEKLKASTETGSEPATNTESVDEDAEPVEPDFGTKDQTWGEYQAAMKEFRKQHDAWVLRRADKAADEKWTERQRQERFDRTVAEAEKVHGKGFDAMRQRVVENTPEGLQIEIGSLEDWPSMVAHLGHADNAEEMESLAAMFAKSPSAAIRELGRIEDRLKKPATQEPAKLAKSAEKPLPEPPVRVGGTATAAPKVDLEKADMRTFKREIQSVLGR